MEVQESHWLAASLASRVKTDADSAQIADAVVSTWRRIDAALGPIIGRGGVAALYARGFQLTRSVHPWLAGPGDPVQAPVDLAALRLVLSQQSSANAAAGGVALLQTFHELLTNLVGAALTDQLLRSVWANPVGGPGGQDTSP
jgi:hypothetical protein